LREIWLRKHRSVDVVLIVDQKWRDLPGMAALAVWLEDGFGVSTELVSYPQWRRCLSARRPQAIVVTHMNGPRNRAIADVASAMGTRVVVIQTEGRPGNAEAMEYAVGKSVDVTGIDLWFTWSEVVRDYMLAEKVLPPEKIIVGGVHRFDFYRSPLNQLLSSRVDFAREHGLDPQRPIISWATNFTHARYVHNNQDFVLRDWNALGLLKFPSFSNPLDYARLDHEARERSLAVMKELLKARPGIQLALKPHPHEEHERYLAYVDACRAEFGPRIAFIRSRYIWDLLNAADVHVQRLCMTGLEAWFLKKPCVELHLLDYYSVSLDRRGATTEAVAGNDLTRDARTLIQRVDYYLSGGSLTLAQTTTREVYVKRWFSNVDGQRTRAHARALADLVREKRGIKSPRLNLSRLKGLVGTGLNRALGRSVNIPLRVDNYIGEDDVIVWRQRVRKALSTEIKALPPQNGSRSNRTADGVLQPCGER
jgi:surface carbohydrate biosynthesis protein